MAAQSEIAMIEKLAGDDNYFFWKVLIEAIIYEKDWSEVILTAPSADESRKTPEWNKINQHVNHKSYSSNCDQERHEAY